MLNRHGVTLLFLGWITQLGLAVVAQGANVIQPRNLEVYPTHAAVSVEVRYAGDDNHNASAQFGWRKSDEAQWHNGVAMTFDRKRRLIWASIWPLEQGQSIEVKVSFQDRDGTPQPLRGKTTVRKMILQPRGGRVLYVSPEGANHHSGTREKPLGTLAHAASLVKPGDVVYALSGTYREGNLFGKLKGTANKPIVFAAAPGHKPILDSSASISQGSWKKVEEGLFVLPISTTLALPGYVAQDGKRMFRYTSLAQLKEDRLRVQRAWFWDAKSKRLYVRTGGSDPTQSTYYLARHPYAIYLSGSQHVVVQGFTIRHYGAAAVRLSEGARGCVLRKNIISNAPGAFFLKGETTRDHAIWHNEIFEHGLVDFSWNAIKASDYARQGIYFTAGRGNSICYNRIHGWFDGICPESWKRPNQLQWNRDCDVMFNDLYNIGDDAIESDGGGVNMRIHGNRIRNSHTAISLAPIERGPVYVTRNQATFKAMMFKLNVGGCTSLGWAYCYHNSGYCLVRGADGGTAISFPPKIPCSHKVFKNNAILCNEWSVRAGHRGYILDANCYYHVPGKPPRKFQWNRKSYRTIAAFQRATGQEKQGLYANPCFRSTPGLGKFTPRPASAALSTDPLVKGVDVGDLRLQSKSPCIDRGVLLRGINESFHGKAPDIGALENPHPHRGERKTTTEPEA